MVGWKLDEMLKKLRGSSRLESAENIFIVLIVAGAVVLSIGIGSTAITTSGAPAIVSMLGAVITFTSTVALVFTWLVKEFKE